MKIKLLTLFVIAMLFASCDSHSGNSYTEIEANVSTDSTCRQGPDMMVSVEEDNTYWTGHVDVFDSQVDGIGHFRYHGHMYIIFATGSWMSIVHDPDCPCNNQRTEN